MKRAKKEKAAWDPRPATYGLDMYKILYYMWSTYGIAIEDKGNYRGFIRSSLYSIYLPEIDPETKVIISLRRDRCREVKLSNLADVRRWIRRDYKRNPEYYKYLWEDMNK